MEEKAVHRRRRDTWDGMRTRRSLHSVVDMSPDAQECASNRDGSVIKGLRVSGLALSIACMVLSPHRVDGGSTACLSHNFAYASTSDCGKKGVSFNVKRCAESPDALAAYVQSLDLNGKMNPDTCKQMWLRGCSNFYRRDKYVVVPKTIACTPYICDQSSFYSNCVSNDDCRDIPDVRQGLPVPGAFWPFANDTVLPVYRPCCTFFESFCNGASCLGRDGATCPLSDAEKNGFCTRSNCWEAGTAHGRNKPRLLLSLLLCIVGIVIGLLL